MTTNLSAAPAVLHAPGDMAHAVSVVVSPALVNRNRLTCAFRPFLAIPHLLLVGGPLALGASLGWNAEHGRVNWGAGTGALGAMAAVCALIAWFAIVFGSAHPAGLWNLGAFYLRWRVRGLAYLTLLRDEYPPFGDGSYPATIALAPPIGPRNRLTVGLRILLALPHILALWVMGLVWAVTTLIAWFSILFTGAYPVQLYHFGVGMLRWGARVEAYLLLLRDEYPPFTLS